MGQANSVVNLNMNLQVLSQLFPLATPLINAVVENNPSTSTGCVQYSSNYALQGSFSLLNIASFSGGTITVVYVRNIGASGILNMLIKSNYSVPPNVQNFALAPGSVFLYYSPAFVDGIPNLTTGPTVDNAIGNLQFNTIGGALTTFEYLVMFATITT